MSPEAIVDAVISELLGRGGFDAWWYDVDREIRDEIKTALAVKVEQACAATAVAEQSDRAARVQAIKAELLADPTMMAAVGISIYVHGLKESERGGEAGRCPVAGATTGGEFRCTREMFHFGPCAAVEVERPTPPDEQRGFYLKYRVERLNDPTGKHRDCLYFVLDERHDKFAGPALRAYADACESEFPQLASDLRERHGT